MALFHLHVTQIKRSAGQSVVACAAYRAGEKLFSKYYGEVSDYAHKGGVVYADILLPPQAPAEYQDRATLWNAVEKAERGKKAQLAYTYTAAPLFTPCFSPDGGGGPVPPPAFLLFSMYGFPALTPCARGGSCRFSASGSTFAAALVASCWLSSAASAVSSIC